MAVSMLKNEYKQLGTVETLQAMLTHRKILSECIKQMDSQKVNYITEEQIFTQLKLYTQHVKADVRRRLRIAFATDNLLNANIIMDVDATQGPTRLYFQSSVLDVVRLCDVSLFKKLTDVQLKTHLQFLNQTQQALVSGQYSFLDEDPDFVEFMDNVFMQLGRLLSDIKQNVTKMQSVGQELEQLTATSIQTHIDTQTYISAKQVWLDEIVHLYERHMLPVLLFLNPDTTYAEYEGLHAIILKISQILDSHQHVRLAHSCQSYALSLLNFYRPIEQTASAVNRFIHKQRDSIERFNALEHFYQHSVRSALHNAYSNSLTKSKLGSEGIVLPDFVIQQKGFRRPVGFAFHHSDAYFKNIFNELDARCQDLKHIGDFTQVSGFTRYDKVADERQQRFERLCEVLQQMTLRPTDDVIQMLHQRLQDEFPEYALYDVISGVQVLVSQQQSRTNNANNFRFMTTNRFAQIQHAHQTYRYRKIRCVSTEIKEN